MDFMLSKEHEMARTLFKEFAENEVKPLAQEIDEQHRFGVSQRVRLKEKGQNPNILVMTATPIPRTLAVVLYGDLDVSVIDELPPGRKLVKTIWAKETERKKIDIFLGERLKNNDQIYIVCPLVEETENADESLKNAVEYSKELDYVKNARLMGASHFRIMFVHILPNTLPIILSSITIGFNNAVLTEAALSFLGLGVQPPDPSLGRMLSEAQAYLTNAPWYALAPGLTIIFTVLGFSLINERE